MKKFLFLVIINVLGYNNYAQYKTQDVFNRNQMVWYGLDFTKAKFIGQPEQVKGLRPINEFEIVNKYIPAWNELIVMEPMNFDLKNTFWKKSVYYDLKPVEALNSKIPTQNLITINSVSISKKEVEEMVSAYKEGDKNEGLGLVFIIESFNKPNLLASMWVVFFDIKTKNVLLSEYCIGKPVGFGFRNYWAGALKHVLNDIRFGKFNRWNKENSKSTNSNVAIVK